MTPLLAIKSLHCRFATARGTTDAVRDVALEVWPGETVGLVGESGCGKSTLARSIVGLHRPVSGSIRLLDDELLTGRPMTAEQRRTVQFVFQDPFGSLNPRRTAATLIREPLDVHRIGTRAERRRRVAELMEQVGLRPEWGNRRPHEFSGGQRQRIGIARALALRPRLLVCDEPVSALDVSVQAQIVALIRRLCDERGMAAMLVTHDIGIVAEAADDIAVMYAGRVVETGAVADVLAEPHHPYTSGLLASTPELGAERQDRLPQIEGTAPRPGAWPPGCTFHPRCVRSTDVCLHDVPPLMPAGALSHACWNSPHG